MRKSVVYGIRAGVAKKKHLIRKVFLPTFVLSLGIIGIFAVSTVLGDRPAPSASVDIEQCANGPAAGPFNICKLLSGNDGYVTGNVVASKAHWREGDFLPYRAIVVAPNSGTQEVAFSFDTSKSSELKHAVDYLSSYDFTETTGSANSKHANQADPCSDEIALCNPAVPSDSEPILVPTSLTSLYPSSCAGGIFSGSPTTGSLKGWVSTGTINITSVTVGAPDTASTNCPSKLTINFTLNNSLLSPDQ